MLTLTKFKIGDNFIQTYLTFRELKEMFEKEYGDQCGSLATKIEWLVEKLLSENKAEKLESGFEDITYKLDN